MYILNIQRILVKCSKGETLKEEYLHILIYTYVMLLLCRQFLAAFIRDVNFINDTDVAIIT